MRSVYRLVVVPRLVPEFWTHLLLAVHALMLCWSALIHSPTFIEVCQVPAGLSHWRLGRFELAQVNPPLVRLVATVPLLAMDLNFDWSHYSEIGVHRSERNVGRDFVQSNQAKFISVFRVARISPIAFSILGAWVCGQWAARLHGKWCGVVATSLWVTSPDMLGHGCMVGTDVPAASFAVAAAYLFWHMRKNPSVGAATLSGVVLGAAQLTKFTLLILYPAFAVCVLLGHLAGRSGTSHRKWDIRSSGVRDLTISMCVSISIINLGYSCDGTLKTLESFRFYSRALSGVNSIQDCGGNRFVESCIGRIVLPFPECYIHGLDTQMVDFERGLDSYLFGEWRPHGWWYYYILAVAIKQPVGTLGLILANLVLAISTWRCRSSEYATHVSVLAPVIAILLVLSVQSGFSVHSRYLIPILPFLFIWCSRAFQLPRLSKATRGITLLLLLSAEASSVSIYPHTMSYFNELSGGPLSGGAKLLDSNISCGQDLLLLADWLKQHPEIDRIRLAAYSPINARLFGIRFHIPNACCTPLKSPMDGGRAALFEAGWYAIDVNYMYGSRFPIIGPDDEVVSLFGSCDYRCYRHVPPLHHIGYSFVVFRIDEDGVVTSYPAGQGQR